MDFIIYQSNLTSIAPSDVLLIWGTNSNLTSYRSSIEKYLSAGSGAVEIMDFSTSTLDAVQQNIFGIAFPGGGWGPAGAVMLKPSNGTQLTYRPYRLFYSLPYRLKGSEDAKLTTICTQSNKTGNFSVLGAFPTPLTRKFWICDGSSVYFDTNGDGIDDTGALHAGDSKQGLLSALSSEAVS